MSGTYKVTPFQEKQCPRTCAVIVGVSLLLLLLLAPLLFINPASDDPAVIRTAGPVDAVVVLGGSPDVRLAAATDLVVQLEPPPTLVLAVQYEAPLLRCGDLPGVPDVAVACFSPAPATTAGEAQWIAEESRDRGWDRVVVATSDVHLTRARVLVERCVDTLAPATDVLYLSADTRVASVRGVWAILTESASLLGTWFDHRPACR